MRGERIVYTITDGGELVAPIGTDLLRVEAQHGTAEVGILGTDVKNGMTRGHIDGWQENLRATCLASPTDDFVAISGKLLAVQMAMGVDVIEN